MLFYHSKIDQSSHVQGSGSKKIQIMLFCKVSSDHSALPSPGGLGYSNVNANVKLKFQGSTCTTSNVELGNSDR